MNIRESSFKTMFLLKYGILKNGTPSIFSRLFNLRFRLKVIRVTQKPSSFKNLAKLNALIPLPAFTGGVNEEQNKILLFEISGINSYVIKSGITILQRSPMDSFHESLIYIQGIICYRLDVIRYKIENLLNHLPLPSVGYSSFQRRRILC